MRSASMKAKALSHEVAFKVVDSRQQGIPYKLLAHELNYAGHGDQWDESQADTAADRLRQLRDQILQSGDSLTVNTFDRHACPIIHRALDVPSNLAAEDGFWRWLAVEKFPDVIEARHGRSSEATPAHQRNYGINTTVTNNRIAILWFRADMVYDPFSSDPYALAKQPAHTDFWESGIIRHRYAWCRNLARAFVKFQYQDPSSNSAFLHSTNSDGVRELYKRLRRLHATVSYEFLTDREIRKLLFDKSSDLKRA